MTMELEAEPTMSTSSQPDASLMRLPHCKLPLHTSLISNNEQGRNTSSNANSAFQIRK